MSKKKPSADRKAARIAKQVSERLSRALAGIDLANIGKPRKPVRRAAATRRRQQTASPTQVQPTLFDKGADR